MGKANEQRNSYACSRSLSGIVHPLATHSDLRTPRLCIFMLTLADPSPFKSMESTHTKTRYRVKIKQMGEYSYEIAVPNCGKECVCCNAFTTDRITARIGNSDQFHLSGPIMLPVCPDCKFRVNWRNMFWDKVFGIATGFCALYFLV